MGIEVQIRLLKAGYKKSEEFYQAFIQNDLSSYGEKYIEEPGEISIGEVPDFPIYFANGKDEDTKKGFIELINTISIYFSNLDREYLLDELFWHSYLCIYKREYLLETYPEIKESQKEFENIVTKNFDWQNYIYKCVLAYQYVTKHADKEEYNKYYDLIWGNRDVFNYIIKYDIFRNSNFLYHMLQIIDETNTSKILKAHIKNRPDLGKDPRYGRRVVYEFNKSYPAILAPMLDKDQLKVYFKQFLSYYYVDGDIIEESDNEEE